MRLSQAGGELLLRGEQFGVGGAVVLIDGVPAQSVVRESSDVIRARVPPLPRAGTVDVELLSADGARVVASSGLTVVAPELEVRP